MRLPGFTAAAFTAILLVVVFLGVVYVFWGWLRDRSRARRRRILEWAQVDLLVVLFHADADAACAADRLAGVPGHLLLDLIQRLASDLSGDADQRIRKLVRTAGLTRQIRSRLRSRSWRRRAQGAALAGLLPDGDPLRMALLNDPYPVVRARAAESLAESDVVGHVNRLVELLDDDVQAVRFAAQQALLRSDARIVPALREYLSSPESPGIVWALEVAANLPDPRLIPAIRQHMGSPDPRRRAIATEAIVPWLDDPGILVERLRDADADVRATAARAAGAAKAELLAAHVGRLLSDEAWSVRQQAGLALATMGPAGIMTLRVHLEDPDPYARDMAALMLDTVSIRDVASRFVPASQLAEGNAA